MQITFCTSLKPSPESCLPTSKGSKSSIASPLDGSTRSSRTPCAVANSHSSYFVECDTCVNQVRTSGASWCIQYRICFLLDVCLHFPRSSTCFILFSRFACCAPNANSRNWQLRFSRKAMLSHPGESAYSCQLPSRTFSVFHPNLSAWQFSSIFEL